MSAICMCAVVLPCAVYGARFYFIFTFTTLPPRPRPHPHPLPFLFSFSFLPQPQQKKKNMSQVIWLYVKSVLMTDGRGVIMAQARRGCR
jgi:hypothetical protein